MADKASRSPRSARPANIPTVHARGNWPPLALYGLFAGIALLIAVGVLAQQRREEARLVAAVRAMASKEAYNALLNFYRTRNNYASGRRTFARLADDYPDDATPLLMGQLLERNYQYTRSLPPDLSLAERAVTRNSGTGETFALLGQLFLMYGRTDLAREAIDKALAKAPEDAYTHYVVGQLHKQLGEAAPARAAYEHCVSGATAPATETDRYGRVCAAQLLPANRALTVTLQADRLTIDGHVRFLTPLISVSNSLRSGSAGATVQDFAWGDTLIGTRDGVFFWQLPWPSRVASDEAWFERSFSYNELLEGVRVDNRLPDLSVFDLPLSAYTSPTTVTIRGDPTLRINALPYTSVANDTTIWRLDQQLQVGQAFTFEAQGSFNTFLLPLTTSPYWFGLSYVMLYSSSTIWGLVVLVHARRRERGDAPSRDEPWWRRMAAPAGPLPWLFESALIVLSAFTVMLPIYQLLVEGGRVAFSAAFTAYLVVLGVLLGRLLVAGLSDDTGWLEVSIQIGAIIFVCYLVPRIAFQGTVFGPLFMIVGAVGYYSLIVGLYGWLRQLRWKQVGALYSPQRSALVSTIEARSRADELKAARRDLEQSLAKGVLKAPEYRESLALVEEMAHAQNQADTQLREQLGLTEQEDPRRLLFRLGPGATPLANALYALAFGALPYLCFLWLAAFQGDVALGGGVQSLLFTTIGVAWGPIYLFFFGYSYRLIVGDFGVVKDLTLSGVLGATLVASAALWHRTPPDPVQVWGDLLRLLVTFVFTGALMDWAASGYSWPAIRRSYASPAFTTLAAVVGTTITTVITAVLTGTLSQLLTVAVQTGAAAFGAPQISGGAGP